MAKDPRPQINVRADAADIDRWQAAAKREGLSLSAWLRWMANKAARLAEREERKATA